MFKKGDLIVYGGNGVCVVENVSTLENTIQANGDKLYYELKIIAQNGGVSYVPVDSPVFMRPIMSKQEAEALVKKIPEIPIHDYCGVSLRDSTRVYRDAINSHDSEVIIGLIKHLMAVDEKKRAQNKKLSATEERFLVQARRIIDSELMVALNLDHEQLMAYIQKHI